MIEPRQRNYARTEKLSSAKHPEENCALQLRSPISADPKTVLHVVAVKKQETHYLGFLLLEDLSPGRLQPRAAVAALLAEAELRHGAGFEILVSDRCPRHSIDSRVDFDAVES